MGPTEKYKKRILIFLVIPLLAAVPLFTEDLILKIISAVILTIYVGFIIFLRESSGQVVEEEEIEDAIAEAESSADYEDYATDEGEEIKIISGSKDVDIITSDEFSTELSKGKSSYLKPADLIQSYQKIALEEVPEDINHDEQFTFLLDKILTVAKDSFMAHTAIFFWYNDRKKKLSVERFVSSSNDLLLKKLDIEDDILSKIVTTHEPEILADITPQIERDVLRYYDAPQNIKSFVGVPLFYGGSVAGLLALDSKANDVFGLETIYSLGRFVRVLSIIISLFEEKFQESHAEQRLSALLTLLNADRKLDNLNELHSSIINAVDNLIPWDVFSFIYFNPAAHKFTVSKIVNKTSLKYVGENLEVEIKNTIAGKAIASRKPVNIDDISDPKYFRFAQSEDLTFDGSFLALPLIFEDKIYGVFCFEHLKKNYYQNDEIQFLQKVVKLFSFIIYSYSTQSVLRRLLNVDVETKLLNSQTFRLRVGDELYKDNKSKTDCALVLIKVDDFIDQQSLFESDPFPRVLRHVRGILSESIPPVSIAGRLDERIFGIYLYNITSKDAFLWAEKLRIKVARNPVRVSSQQSTFTISAGVASIKGKESADELIGDAELALLKAVEKGGNAVKSIN